MRWFLIDRFEEFISGQRATAVKAVAMTEPSVDDYSVTYPRFPSSLIVEGIAQAGGILVSQINDFKNRVVLAKINHSAFHFFATPGDRLVIDVEILNLQEFGAVVSGMARVDGRIQSEVELVFAYLGNEFEGVQLFEPGGFCRVLRCLKLFDVGVNPDGTPIHVPQHMLDAERFDLEKYDQYFASQAAS
ncbi:MAG TPA: 3-hydroxyacyl-ACP dehydratase FabZ family protein [Pirellulaceae bacterium]|nr:3-hydroxyacyl-ACP dehydratase FabZ family protein [Pirellulaceae bacterium]HMO92265.1 3-hydroxyacyl-ACP dehydratase FabZ family protein [Pirellulaceae bacterium]HMP70081.1 3-hydroxyacyl-ACP dehydratase FabZ family protein [Pirellulaceae bacterium]